MLTLGLPRLQPTRTATDDLLRNAFCTGCSTLVGHHVTPIAPKGDKTCFRLLKYATRPLGVSPSPSSDAHQEATAEHAVSLERKPIRQYSLATHVMAEMLEIGQAHACHRFVCEDAETEQPRVLVSCRALSTNLRYIL